MNNNAEMSPVNAAGNSAQRKKRESLHDTVTRYGFKFDQKKVIGIFVAMAAASFGLAFAFNLTPIFMIPFIVIGLLFVPGLIKNAYKRQFEAQRFQDANNYLEQMLYSFMKDRKVLTALKDTRAVFDNESHMSHLLNKAIHHIETVFDEDADPERVALKMIEDEYPTEKLRTAHKLMLEAEANGGDPTRTMRILLEDRAAWDRNNHMLVASMKKTKTTVIAALVVTLFLCVLFVRILGQTDARLDISQIPFIELMTVFVWFVDMMIYKKCDSKLSVDFLKERVVDPEKVRHAYDTVLKHDGEKGFIRGLKHGAAFLIAAVLFAVLKVWILVAVCAVIGLILVLNDQITYRFNKKIVAEEVRASFPKWLMSITLLTQSLNVQNAIMASYKNAPEILKPELSKLLKALKQNPESKEPFAQFMAPFDMKDITASMMMLYASQGGTGSPAEQIENILKRNQTMVDDAQKKAIDDQMAGMYAYFLAPSLSSTIKLMCDMVVFFMVSLSSAGSMM